MQWTQVPWTQAYIFQGLIMESNNSALYNQHMLIKNCTLYTLMNYRNVLHNI